jgi:hypothetical protein
MMNVSRVVHMPPVERVVSVNVKRGETVNADLMRGIRDFSRK